MPPCHAEGLEVTCQIEDLAVGLGMTTFIGPVRSVHGQHEVRCRAAGMWADGVLHWNNLDTGCVRWQAEGVQEHECWPGPGTGHSHKELWATNFAALGFCHLQPESGAIYELLSDMLLLRGPGCPRCATFLMSSTASRPVACQCKGNSSNVSAQSHCPAPAALEQHIFGITSTPQDCQADGLS